MFLGHEMKNETRIQSFYDRVQTAGDCWEWTGGKDRQGYGRMRVNGKHVSAHRFSYELNVGRIPSGLMVCHRCDNPGCVKPSHLFIGTAKDNNHDAVKKGRTARTCGTQNGNAKLKPSDIVRIKELCKSNTQRQVARKFGISQMCVSKIVRGLKWSAPF